MRIEVGATRRSFELLVPAGTPSSAPLVIVLHGLAGTAAGIREQSGFDAVAREHGFAVAYPQAAGLVATWRAAPELGESDVRFMAALIDAVAELTPIDRSAVFLVGMSNGGGMAARVGCERPDLVAGVGSVAGAHQIPPCVPGSPVPLLAFHGTADRVVPYGGVPGVFPGVPAWAEAWARADGCDGSEVAPVVATAVATVWQGCTRPVVLVTIDRGRHDWPGSPRADRSGVVSVSASEMLGEFFTAIRTGAAYDPAP